MKPVHNNLHLPVYGQRFYSWIRDIEIAGEISACPILQRRDCPNKCGCTGFKTEVFNREHVEDWYCISINWEVT